MDQLHEELKRPINISTKRKEIKNKTAPVIIPDVEEFENQGKTIVILKVNEYPVKPISFKGKYFKRIKNTNHQQR